MLRTPILILLLLTTATFAQQQRRSRNDRFANTGIQVGESLPTDNVKVFRLTGKVGNLAKVWADRPTLLVTSSLTCPVARRQFDAVSEIAHANKGRLWVVIVYTIEAHPKGSPSPHSGREWVTSPNEREGILRAQPQNIEQRIALAKEFKERLGVNVAIAIDTMDNAVWKKLGTGPNSGILVDTDGKIIAKHGWFNAPTMTKSIDALFTAKAPIAKPTSASP